VKFQSSPSHGDKKGNPFSLVVLEQEDDAVYYQQPPFPQVNNNSIHEEEPEPPTTAYCVGVHQNWYSLIASQPGLYTVDMHILVPYATARKTGFVFAVPRVCMVTIDLTYHRPLKIKSLSKCQKRTF
jgi:hypothetical protein